MEQQPSTKELKIKIIVAFCLVLSSLQFLVTTSAFQSLFSSLISAFGRYGEWLYELTFYGTLVSMNIMALYYINEGKSIDQRPFTGFKKAGQIIAIIALVIIGIVSTVDILTSIF